MEFNEDINMELVREVSGILEKYPAKDVIMSLWYMLLTINISIINQIDDAKIKKEEIEEKEELQD